MNCRHCGELLTHTFLDLGYAPPSNAYLTAEDLSRPETYYPLRVKVCDQCWLVQTEDYADADKLFSSDYAYFSSTSSSWLAHAKTYAETIVEELALDDSSFVIEVASNDGYLLKNFIAAGIPCLGIEPTDSTATAAEQISVPVLREFFGEALGKRLAASGKLADLIVGNNVYAHVPDINDFTRGLRAALKPGGTITLEFPHLMQLIAHSQFDTVYHEHFSYLSLYTVNRIFTFCGLRIWHVEELPTHGGSLRIYGCHENDLRPTQHTVIKLLDKEKRFGLQNLSVYLEFQQGVNRLKNEFLRFLIEQNGEGKKIAAYGAAAKGNTLLNFAGIKSDLIPFVCDAAISKQGKFMPGSLIPILNPSILYVDVPDILIIFPWNISAEIKEQLSWLESKKTRFFTAVPKINTI
jgi:SAM-dependent methyltransferase